MKELVSIVVPVYNVENEVVATLASISEQSYTNFEVIVINDGSPDNSGAICRTFCEQNPKFRYIEKPNEGVAAARRDGFLASKGEYIIFVDGDDTLPSDAVEILAAAITPDVDIIISGCNVVGQKTIKRRKLSPIEYDTEQYISALLLDKVPHEPWARIFRREMLFENSFPHIKQGQDWLMNIEIATRVRRVKIVAASTYNYIYRATSTIGRTSYSVESRAEICNLASQILKQNALEDRYSEELAVMAMELLFLAIVKGGVMPIGHPWVEQVYRETRGLKLSFRGRVMRLALRNMFFQSLVRMSAFIYRFVLRRER